MILLIDMGNRRIKWAFWQNGTFLNSGAISWRDTSLEAQLDAELAETPDQIIACNVIGAEKEREISAYCARRWALAIIYVRSTSQLRNLKNAYTNPPQLGADRWVAMLGARLISQAAIAVISCGTAVTIDVVDAHGQHQGGVIFPGLMTMREALFTQAHQLVADSEQPEVLAKNTQNAISGGTLYALVGGIERLLVESETALGVELTRIITGGDAELVNRLLAKPGQLAPNLVLSGLLVAEGKI